MTVYEAIQLMKNEGIKKVGFYLDFRGIRPKHFISIEEAERLFGKESLETVSALYIGTWFNRGDHYADTREEKYYHPEIGVIGYKGGI